MKYKHDKYSFLDRITVDHILDIVLFITILLFIIVYIYYNLSFTCAIVERR